MNNTPVNEALCAERRRIEEERFRRDKDRLDSLEPLMRKLSECTVQNAQIIKAHESKLDDHEKRLDEIEHQPKAWMDKIISGIIAAAVAALMGMLIK